MKVIELLEGDVWGCSKDIHEYSEVSQHVYDRIKQHQQDGIQEEEIIYKMVRDQIQPEFHFIPC